MTKILLVEDDELIAASVHDMLVAERFTVEAVGDGLDAWHRLEALDYDLVVLDWNLPRMEGVEILTRLRAIKNSTPVIMLTANSGAESRITGLETGADDYLAKPFVMRELLARIKAILRRPQEIKGEVLTVGDITLDISQFKCYLKGAEIKLLPKEFALLQYLMQNKGRVFSVEELLDRLWSLDSDSSVDAARKCVTRLRQKVNLPDAEPVVKTVIGRGYKVD